MEEKKENENIKKKKNTESEDKKEIEDNEEDECIHKSRTPHGEGYAYCKACRAYH